MAQHVPCIRHRDLLVYPSEIYFYPSGLHLRYLWDSWDNIRVFARVVLLVSAENAHLSVLKNMDLLNAKQKPINLINDIAMETESDF